jgi:putative lipase involved disintegration of autophagic bodies
MNNLENYSILVTGHSLGAAAATILAMLLIPRYPTLRSIGFGTPGATLDIKTCEGADIRRISMAHYTTNLNCVFM